MNSDVLIQPVSARDAGELLTLQRAAYVTEAQIYGDPHLPPLIQSLPDLERELATSLALKAVVSGRIVGAVRATVSNRLAEITRLVVAPDQQRQGIGTALMRAIEGLALAVGAKRFQLFTGDESTANLRLYERLGYREYMRRDLSPRVTLVYLAKDAGLAGDVAATGAGLPSA